MYIIISIILIIKYIYKNVQLKNVQILNHLNNCIDAMDSYI